MNLPRAVADLPREIVVALDMHGCPNRCRHCYLGHAPNPHLRAQDLRWAVAQFRAYATRGEAEPYFHKIKVSSWVREPDYGDDYRRLHQLEMELSDGGAQRFELLSIWRLAHDETYAHWAKQVGPDTCQISFFGLGATQDWFCGRHAAFDDCLLATERLLAVGMKPRWQLFLTRKLIPELDDLLRLVERLHLRERVQALGGVFQLFLHTPGPDGAARQIEHLRPTLAETAGLSRKLVAASCDYLKVDALWHTEAELVAQVIAEESPSPRAYEPPQPLAFFIAGNWDVYANLATLEPWWRLGNLRAEGIEPVLARYAAEEPLGYHLNARFWGRDLARTWGDARGQRVYTNASDLLALWLARACEQIDEGTVTR